jgi:hypothetical protein
MLFATLKAQTIEDKEVFVKSWKQGNEQIVAQIMQVKLTKENFEFEQEITALSGKKYLISVVKNPAVDLKGEHWKALMNEINSDKENNKDFCRDLLLVDYPCDSGGDSFSSQNDIAYFYPSFQYDGANMKIPRREQVPIYPTKTTRKILVDGFFVVIKAGKVEFDEKDKSKIKLFELNIEIKNTCK